MDEMCSMCTAAGGANRGRSSRCFKAHRSHKTPNIYIFGIIFRILITHKLRKDDQIWASSRWGLRLAVTWWRRARWSSAINNSNNFHQEIQGKKKSENLSLIFKITCWTNKFRLPTLCALKPKCKRHSNVILPVCCIWINSDWSFENAASLPTGKKKHVYHVCVWIMFSSQADLSKMRHCFRLHQMAEDYSHRQSR